MSATREGTKAALPQIARSAAAGQASKLPVGAQIAQRLGNPRVQQLLRERFLQPKLTVSQPGDILEQEADRLADQVLRMPEPAADIAATPAPSVQRVCAECRDELKRHPLEEDQQPPQERAAPARALEISPELEIAIHTLAGRGQPLPDRVRAFMEPRFNTDFRAVRVHTDANAHALARAVNAQAFTVGPNIVFGAGHYAPQSERGRQLLAHELVHVVQQTHSTTFRSLQPGERNGSSSFLSAASPHVGDFKNDQAVPSGFVQRAAIHKGNILDEGSCEHLACNSKYACEDSEAGVTCPKGTRNASTTKKFRPLFTCDSKCENHLPCSDSGTWMAMPKSRFARSKCGQDLVICANGAFTHATLRDRSEREAWEVGHGIQDSLGVSPYASFTGSIYGDESDAEFKKDTRCRKAPAADAGVGDGGPEPDAGVRPSGAADGGAVDSAGDAGAVSQGVPDAGSTDAGVIQQQSISRALTRSAQDALQRQEEKAGETKSAESQTQQPPTPLERAKALSAESPATTKDRAAWILKAADEGFVTFNTAKARENVENLRDEKKVESLDPKAAGYDVPILAVEVALTKRAAQRWLDAKGVGTKPSIEFGSMVRSAAGGGPHAKGKAIDINALRMVTTVDATITILDDLDKTVHSYYGVGLPFQGDFFDAADELKTKKAAAEVSAAAGGKPTTGTATGVAEGPDAGTKSTAQAGEKHATATVRDAVVKFESRIYQSAGTRGPDGTWTWQDGVQDNEWNGAYKRLKSQKLKDTFADRRKDGFSFDIFPDNDNHLHLDVR